MPIVTSVRLSTVRCDHRVEKSPFLKVVKPTMGSIQLMRKRVFHRPRNYVDCEMQHGKEPRTGRRCLEGQTADSRLGVNRSIPQRFSGPSQFLAQTEACLTQRLAQELIS